MCISQNRVQKYKKYSFLDSKKSEKVWWGGKNVVILQPKPQIVHKTYIINNKTK